MNPLVKGMLEVHGFTQQEGGEWTDESGCIEVTEGKVFCRDAAHNFHGFTLRYKNLIDLTQILNVVLNYA